LPDVAVTPSEHFNTVLYTGDGNASRTISGAGFAPDLLWGKIRSTTNNHFWFDTLRGANRLISNDQGAEADYSTWFSTLTSDGFTTGTTNANSMNQNNVTFVAWFWKANGSGSANTAGDINSTVSVNTDAGFSIVSYAATGSNATVGHGLSKVPEMIIIKNRTIQTNWPIYHHKNTSAPETDYIKLDTTAATADNATFWNDTAPTSSVFTIGTDGDVNQSGSNMIAYCFHSVDGYSKVGSYTGNGNADGTFIYTGFRPAYVLIKRSNSAGQGSPIFDSARNEFNVTTKRLNSNDNVAEVTTDGNIDLLSNGFKARNTDGSVNTSGGIYIYLAFAETPFKNSNAR